MTDNNPYAPPKAAIEELSANPSGAVPAPEPVFNRRKGIGGWLILVVIGMTLTIIRLSYYVCTTYWPIFSNGTWDQLTTPGTANYHAMWAPLIVFELIGNIGTVVLALLTLIHMFRYSRKTPKFAIGMHSWGLVFVAVDYVLADAIPALRAHPDPESNKELMRAIVGAAVWIPYFLVSKRVKETFVE